jgi:hypothetical protein
MTWEEKNQAFERQRLLDLCEARRWRDYWQKKVDTLEAQDPLRYVSTANK